MTQFNNVKMFMEACDQIINKNDEQQAALYLRLIAEENREFHDEVTDHPNPNELKELLDLIWVAVGYGHSRGYDMDAAWAELTRSNMSKCVDGKVIKDPVTKKVLKPDTYSPADMNPFVKIS